MNLRPYQEVGVRFLASRQHALLADEQGLGKTIQAIGAVAALKARKVLVVCPAGLKLNWKREFETWMPVFRYAGGFMPSQERNIQVLFGRKDRVKPTTDVVIVNYDLLASVDILKQLLSLKFAVGIFDEAHYMKTRSARRTKAVLLKGGVASKCMYKWFLTGTPILNRPVEIYPILKAAAPEVLGSFTNFESFARRYCGGFFDGFQFMAKGATNIEELNERLTKDFMLRRLKKDHLKELPDKQYQIIDVEAADAETKKLIEREFTWSKQDVSYQKDLATGGAELAILRHELARKKVGAAVEHIKGLLEEVDKVVVFCFHKDVIELIHRGLSEYLSNEKGNKNQQVDCNRPDCQEQTQPTDGALSVRLQNQKASVSEHDKIGQIQRLPGLPSEAARRISECEVPAVHEGDVLGASQKNPLRSELARTGNTDKMPPAGDPDFLGSRHKKDPEQPVDRSVNSAAGLSENQRLGGELASQQTQIGRDSRRTKTDNSQFAEKVVVITGDTPSHARQEKVDRFQTDPKTRVFIGQITAAGTGITLTAASTVVFVETSWVPGEIAQAEDRTHRIGQKNAVLVQFLVLAGSLEEHMLKAVVDKKLTIQKIVDERHPEYIFT